MVITNKHKLAERFGVGPRAIDDWVRKGIFPKPFYLTPAIPLWDEADIESLLMRLKNGESHGSNEGQSQGVGFEDWDACGDVHPTA